MVSRSRYRLLNVSIYIFEPIGQHFLSLSRELILKGLLIVVPVLLSRFYVYGVGCINELNICELQKRALMWTVYM